MGVMVLALLWGFAEATLFFIVPDVLLSILAVYAGFKKAAAASLAAGIGAMIGGAVIYSWVQIDPAGVRGVLAKVPGISETMLMDVSRAFHTHGWFAMFAAAFAGVPYKLYAAEAGATGANLFVFLTLTLLARLPRFLLTAAIAAYAGGWMVRDVSLRAALSGLAVFWVLFYLAYFSLLSG
jgi:membrane protein YqaA with SNARE-associated domain